MKRKGVAARRGLKEARSKHARPMNKNWIRKGGLRRRELRLRDISVGLGAKTAGSPHGPCVWRTVPRWPSPYLMLTSRRLDFLHYLTVQRNPLNRRMRNRISGPVAGESGRPLPLCRFGQVFGEIFLALILGNAERSS